MWASISAQFLCVFTNICLGSLDFVAASVSHSSTSRREKKSQNEKKIPVCGCAQCRNPVAATFLPLISPPVTKGNRRIKNCFLFHITLTKVCWMANFWFVMQMLKNLILRDRTHFVNFWKFGVLKFEKNNSNYQKISTKIYPMSISQYMWAIILTLFNRSI